MEKILKKFKKQINTFWHPKKLNTSLKIFKKIKRNKLVILAGSLFLAIGLFIACFNLYFLDKNYPGVSVSKIDVSGKTKEQTILFLKEKIQTPEKIDLSADSQKFELSLNEINFSYDLFETAALAYSFYRSNTPVFDIFTRLQSFSKKENVNLVINLDNTKLDQYISVISNQISKEPVYPFVSFENKIVMVNKGETGKIVDNFKLKEKIIQNLSRADYSPIFIPFQFHDPTLSDEQAQNFKTRTENLLGKSLVLTFEYDRFVFKEKEIFMLLNEGGLYQEDKIFELIETVAEATNRDPQNAVFKFEGGRVQEFVPAKVGVVINQEELKTEIIKQLSFLEESEEKQAEIKIPVQTSSPTITTDQVNDLGINELLGRGTSKFAGSISSRIHNIGVASSKLNGVLVAPDEVFSFNRTLGDVSELTGYKQAYIIKDGKTVLGDGGGVCQVSTTFFRAILDAGLPIFERQAHAYRVAYYEQDSLPGFDATVYDPTTDLKFKNNTPGHLLVQTLFNPRNASLVFEIYGTSDGRVSSTTKPVVTDVEPPPEDLYIDDPNLPAGTIEQIDWKAWGAKVRFNYEVKKDGESIYKKTFYSNYQPWQAKFLRGTGPATP